MTQLTLATPEHASALSALRAQFAEERGRTPSPEDREAALAPLLEGSPYGMAYLLGPVRAPVGYAVVTLGWSLERGGQEAVVAEVFVRPPVRRRGLATGALLSLCAGLAAVGLRAVHFETPSDDAVAPRLARSAGFEPRDAPCRLTRPL